MTVMREWSVAGALLFDEGGRLLLVQNLRRGGALDWTPPGGVIEIAEGETVLDGLAREVIEETGLTVTGWAEQAYEVIAEAPDMGWRLKVEVHVAAEWSGDLKVGDDPDGIVIDARFVDPASCAQQVADAHPWVGEPLAAWLTGWVGAAGDVASRRWSYRLDGAQGQTTITRLHPPRRSVES